MKSTSLQKDESPKKRKQKERKAKKDPDPNLQPGKEDSDNNPDDFGGMNLGNFKKNMGCG